MKKSFFSVAIGTVIVFSGCVTASVQERLSLDALRTLVPGVTTTDEVVKLLGVSPMIVPEEGRENWLYFDGPDNQKQRVALNIDASSKILLGVTWLVASDDFEKDLSVATRLFPGANFKKSFPSWVGHTASGEQIYFDSKLGIKIVVRAARQEVSSISWGDLAGARSVAAGRLSD